MNGTGKRMFDPNSNLSRAMLAQILYNSQNKPTMIQTSGFKDVSSSEWYANAVSWAAICEIITEYSNGDFKPNVNITREQLAVMLYRYTGYPAAMGDLKKFNDYWKVSDYAENAMIWATSEGIMNGKGNGRLDPNGFATRAEVAQMMKNYLN